MIALSGTLAGAQVGASEPQETGEQIGSECSARLFLGLPHYILDETI